MKIEICENLEYIAGHLRYGHREGIVNIPEEDFEEFKNDPINYLEENDLQYECPIIIDDYEIDDCGSPTDIEWKIIPEEKINPILHACGLESRPRWIPVGEYSICSNCGSHSGIQFDGVEEAPFEYPYCPYCGSKMCN